MHSPTKQNIRAICKDNKTLESCGFVVVDPSQSVKVLKCKNVHRDPKNFFKVSPQEYLKIKLNNKIIASYHSHVSTSAKPSVYDKDMFEELCIPYYIYSVKDDSFFLGFPDSYNPPPLLGRVYAEDIFQCSTLVKDYFQLKLGKNIGGWLDNWIIPENWSKSNRLMERALNKHAVEIPKEEMSPHDIVLFCIKLKGVFHMGIFLGENELLHQPLDCLSSQIMMDERWLSKVYKVYRNKEL